MLKGGERRREEEEERMKTGGDDKRMRGDKRRGVHFSHINRKSTVFVFSLSPSITDGAVVFLTRPTLMELCVKRLSEA